MRKINVISWGGGTQSTALMLLALDGKLDFKPDYIIFADTNNEMNIIYNQINKIVDYVKKYYNFDITIINSGDDILIDHIMYFKGIKKRIDVAPFWVRDIFGNVGLTPFKQCTHHYKINAVYKYLREHLKLKQFRNNQIHINNYLGYSLDEQIRSKPNHLSYVTNKTPLIDIGWNKEMCVKYVLDKIGFKPISSVCNMCFANRFERVKIIYNNDKEAWSNLLLLDEAMATKPKSHRLTSNVFLYKWQAQANVRLKDIDMNNFNPSGFKQLTIFDDEFADACIGGCGI